MQIADMVPGVLTHSLGDLASQTTMVVVVIIIMADSNDNRSDRLGSIVIETAVPWAPPLVESKQGPKQNSSTVAHSGLNQNKSVDSE